jgi:hypothetical protein
MRRVAARQPRDRKRIGSFKLRIVGSDVWAPRMHRRELALSEWTLGSPDKVFPKMPAFAGAEKRNDGYSSKFIAPSGPDLGSLIS